MSIPSELRVRWERTGSLYTNHNDEQIQEEILAALEDEFGPMVEEVSVKEMIVNTDWTRFQQ